MKISLIGFLLVISVNLYGQQQLQSLGIKALKDSKIAVDLLQNNFYDASWECSNESTNPWNHSNIWNAYNTLEVLVDYTKESADTAYLNVIEKFADNKCAYDDSKFAGYDDAQWTAISLIKAYQLTKKESYLHNAIDLWNYILKYSWDTNFCGGGLWWDVAQTYKNAITNELFILLSTMLYLETKENKYNAWAIKTWKWFDESNMLSSKTIGNRYKNLVNDGINSDCKNNNGGIWTYNQAVLIGGLVNLWKINKDEKFLTMAANVASSSIEYFTQNGILGEKPYNFILVENLNTDQQQFKGIFCRYTSELYKVLPSNSTTKLELRLFLQKNYLKVVDIYPSYQVGHLWNKSAPHSFNAISQTSAIDLFLSLIKINRLKK